MREEIEKVIDKYFLNDSATKDVINENKIYSATQEINNIFEKELKIADDRWKRAEDKLKEMYTPPKIKMCPHTAAAGTCERCPNDVVGSIFFKESNLTWNGEPIHPDSERATQLNDLNPNKTFLGTPEYPGKTITLKHPDGQEETLDVVSQPRKHIPFENIDQLPTSNFEDLKSIVDNGTTTMTVGKITHNGKDVTKEYFAKPKGRPKGSKDGVKNMAENIKCLIQSCKGKERCLEHCPCDCHSKSICCEKCSGRIEDENGFGRQYGCLNDNCKCHLKKVEDFWVAWVWVSRAAPDVRYSRFFDSKKEAQTHTEPIKGTKLVKVKVLTI